METTINTGYLNLKKFLPRGSMSQIADKHKVSKAFVTEVAKGVSFDENIMSDLLETAESRKEALQKANERLSKL